MDCKKKDSCRQYWRDRQTNECQYIKTCINMSISNISNIIDDSATGNNLSRGRSFNYKFEKYVITVLLDEFQKFKGITDVKINKDFLESRHKRASQYSYDDYFGD